MGDVVPEQRKRVPAANNPSLFPIAEPSGRITDTDDGITSDLTVVGSCRFFVVLTYQISTERY